MNVHKDVNTEHNKDRGNESENSSSEEELLLSNLPF